MPEVVLLDGDDGPALDNGSVRVSVHLNGGTFDVTLVEDGAPSLNEASTAVSLHEGPTFTSRGIGFLDDGAMTVKDAHGSGRAIVLRREADADEPELVLTVALYEDHPFAIVRSELINRGRSPLRVAAFRVADGGRVELGALPAEWRFYKEGWQDWSPALVLPVSGEDIVLEPPVVAPVTRPETKEGRFLSELMTVVAAPAGDAVLAAFTSAADQFSQVWLERDTGTLTAASWADGIEVAAGKRLSSEALLIEPSRRPLESMRRYGRALGSESGATPWPKPVSGWCSWYYYFQAVSEDEMLANLRVISERRRELPLDYVQIDDGYQAGIGDWLTPNEKFPHGMGWLADRIHERGLKAGLWLAPFLMGEKSRLWQEHPEWPVQYKPGKPHIASLNWDQSCYALDLTRGDVIEWLDGVFRAVFDDWGYDYAKIDFIYAGAVDGFRHDPNVTRAQAYRRGIETIRKVAGERFILGCGQPIGPSIGVVNGARIGPDVAPFWHPVGQRDQRNTLSEVSTLNAIRNALSRFWMHGSLWLNDPDCLLVRDAETALSADEVRTLATVIGLSGGMVLDSDKLNRLPDERRAIISMLLPVYGKSAVPLDLFDADGLPRLVELDCGTHGMLGVFNWADKPAENVVLVPEAASHLYEVWSGDYLGVKRDGVSLTIPAHGCALLSVHPALGRPQVVGSTFHLLQGAVEIAAEVWDGRVLTLRLRPVAKAHGELLIAVPDGVGTPSAEGTRIEQGGHGLWAAGLRVDKERDLVLRFG